MSKDKKPKHNRADELRKHIKQQIEITPEDVDNPDMKPGESPGDYINRRTREISRKKPTQK